MRWFNLMAMMVVVTAIGCGMGEDKSRTVYVQDDSKILTAFDEAAKEASRQTALLEQLVSSQERLIDKFEQKPLSTPSGGSDWISTSLEANLSETEKIEQAKPKVSAEVKDSLWPESIRLQVWRDGSPVCNQWMRDELPLLDVKPEIFEVYGDLASKYNVTGFTIMLAKEGKIVDRSNVPFSASQLLRNARLQAGEVQQVSVSTGSGCSCRCVCPNCATEFDCTCNTGNTSVGMSGGGIYTPSAGSMIISQPVQAKTFQPVYYSTQTRTNVSGGRRTVRMKCEGGICRPY